ncbi:hypothetical protein SGPA1_11603 [Streptomyces misionensis JCM 4497]
MLSRYGRRTHHHHRTRRAARARGARRPGARGDRPTAAAARDGLPGAVLHPGRGRAPRPADPLGDAYGLPVQGHGVLLVAARRSRPGLGVPGPEAGGGADQGPSLLLRRRRVVTAVPAVVRQSAPTWTTRRLPATAPLSRTG